MIARVFLLLLLINISCQKEQFINDYSSKISFDITTQLLEHEKIDCMDIDEDGNLFAGSDSVLYYINGSKQESYNLGFGIMDLAISPDKSVWIGTNGGGLVHFSGKNLTWYNNANAGLPRDYVRHVEIAPDGDVWFTSCAFKLGGLGIYNGRKFEFLTPENSPLNQNIVEDIEIDDEGTIYIATSGTVGRTNIYRIEENSWECLGDKEGTFYWVFSFTVGPSGVIYLVEDYALSSAFIENKLFRFADNSWQIIDSHDIMPVSFFSRLKADKRDYLWLAGSDEKSACLHVFNGKSWVSSPEGLLPDDFITAIETDSDNNIWVGTYQNGILMLKQ